MNELERQIKLIKCMNYPELAEFRILSLKAALSTMPGERPFEEAYIEYHKGAIVTAEELGVQEMVELHRHALVGTDVPGYSEVPSFYDMSRMVTDHCDQLSHVETISGNVFLRAIHAGSGLLVASVERNASKLQGLDLVGYTGNDMAVTSLCNVTKDSRDMASVYYDRILTAIEGNDMENIANAIDTDHYHIRHPNIRMVLDTNTQYHPASNQPDPTSAYGSGWNTPLRAHPNTFNPVSNQPDPTSAYGSGWNTPLGARPNTFNPGMPTEDRTVANNSRSMVLDMLGFARAVTVGGVDTAMLVGMVRRNMHVQTWDIDCPDTYGAEHIDAYVEGFSHRLRRVGMLSHRGSGTDILICIHTIWMTLIIKYGYTATVRELFVSLASRVVYMFATSISTAEGYEDAQVAYDIILEIRNVE